MKSLLYYISLMLLLVTGSLKGQTVISGTIVDTKREPVPFANIVLKGTTEGTTSDEYGNFRITSYRTLDTLSISAVGYTTRVIPIRPYTGQHVTIPLQENVYSLNEVSVLPGENPAHPILRNIIQNKSLNDPDNFPSWQSKVYNKLEVDLKNLGKPKKNKKFWEDMEFVFENLDTLPDDSVPYLPVFITESVSKYYHSKEENASKEVILANRLSGVRTKTITQFTGKFYQDFNIYKNFINVDNIGLISPINDQWNLFYRYYLADSLNSGDLKLYKIDFKPRLAHEAAFEGSMWVIDSLFAVYKIDMSISTKANINFLNKLEIRKMYVLKDSMCIPEKEEILADFNVEGNNKNRTIGIIGRKTSVYQDFEFAEPPEDLMASPFQTKVEKDALHHPPEYWTNERPERLNIREQGIYDMVDSLQNVPKFKSITEIVETIIFGYKDLGKFEIGPYFYMYSYNPIEGNRIRLGGRTTKEFNEKLRLDGYIAYGFKDNHMKYSVGGYYYFNKQPMKVLSMHFEHDNQLLGKSQNAFMEDNFLSSLISRNPNNKLTLTDQLDVQYQHEWFTGLNTTGIFKWQYIRPGRNVPFYEPDSTEAKALYNKEVGINTHIAIGETFIPGDFQRISLGSKRPIFNVYTGIGSVRLNKTDYIYGRIHLDIFDKLPINPIGYTLYYLQAGTVLGSVPFPLLKLHEGNETLTNDLYAFNLMNYYEFASDKYASLFIEHHFQGFFLNKIPLFRALKLREVGGFKILYGELSDTKHRQILFPDGLTGIGKEPYMEASAGIENIFQLIRIDSIWRLNYLNHTDNIPDWGIRVSLHIRF
ncbi:DUF5686 family protein [Saccharicrinis sp. FJH54]|uniref:DUF5686 and carboxypeptidase-like regulatory domain-containing protein n=1 Tax=Saccharicrinis sp. FJH54 TaxID=3344665 RepID=UPI0035D465A0